MARNLATITGVAVGLELAKDKDAGYFLIPALGGAFGAYAGYRIGTRMKARLLIYDANPRTIADSQSSKLSSRAEERPRKVIAGQ